MSLITPIPVRRQEVPPGHRLHTLPRNSFLFTISKTPVIRYIQSSEYRPNSFALVGDTHLCSDTSYPVPSGHPVSYVRNETVETSRSRSQTRTSITCCERGDSVSVFYFLPYLHLFGNRLSSVRGLTEGVSKVSPLGPRGH